MCPLAVPVPCPSEVKEFYETTQLPLNEAIADEAMAEDFLEPEEKISEDYLF